MDTSKLPSNNRLSTNTNVPKSPVQKRGRRKMDIKLYQRPDSKYYWMKWHYQGLLRRESTKTLNNKISVYGEKLVNEIFESLPNSTIEKLPLKFDCITIDLISWWETVTNEGGLRREVLTSASIPGVFPPVAVGNQLLLDGGATDSIPVQIVKWQGA